MTELNCLITFSNWLLGDHQGSTSMTTDASGVMVNEARYSAFGEIRYQNGTLKTDYLYTGQRQEAEIGLYYYVARWYDPAIGRFIQADSVVPNPVSAKGFDRFSYGFNNPLMYSDPSGHTPIVDDCNFYGTCTETGTAPTPIDSSNLSSFVNDAGTKVGGEQVYSLYLNHWGDRGGLHWRVFGQDGAFSFWDFLSYMLYWESNEQPEYAEVLANATIRFFYETNLAGIMTIETIANWWGRFSESTARRFVNWPYNEVLTEGIKITDIAKFKIFGKRWLDPGEWAEGFNDDEPFGFGNLSVYPPSIVENISALYVYIHGDDPFIVPSGCAWAKAYGHYSNANDVQCPAVQPGR